MKYLRRISENSLNKSFESKEEVLTAFFYNNAINYDKINLARVYTIESEKEIIAYITLSSDSLPVKRMNINYGECTNFRRKEKEYLKKLGIPHGKNGYENYPAIKIGRFSVNSKYMHKGIGTFIMKEICMEIISNSIAAAFFLLVDSKKEALGFYKNIGFKELSYPNDYEDVPMYIPIADIFKIG